MRTVPLVFLAAALSTQLVLGAPLVETRPRSESLSTNKSYYRISRLDTRASQLIDNPALRTVGVAKAPEGSAGPDSSSSKQLPQENHDYSDDYKYDNMKRAGDDQTAGGNAYTGNSGNVSSGDIYNLAGSDSTITNASGSKPQSAYMKVSRLFSSQITSVLLVSLSLAMPAAARVKVGDPAGMHILVTQAMLTEVQSITTLA